jgi:hypothetical protein
MSIGGLIYVPWGSFMPLGAHIRPPPSGHGYHTGHSEANRWASSLAHYARREPGILDISSKYSLKIP